MEILYTSSKYLFVKDGVYYYIRRVPRAIAEHYRLATIRVSLRTKLHSTAVRRMAKINQEIERDWEQLMFSSVSNIVDRFRTKNTATYISSKNTSFESDAPTLLEAMDFYLSEQGSERPKGFYTSTKRATAYLCKSVGNKPIDQYVRADANTLRDYLINERGISANSAKRVISSIKALIAFTAREHDIPAISAFLSVHFAGADQVTKPRHPIPVKVIKALQKECLTINDTSRLLIALISDTGMRLNEALGLVAEDIVLNEDTPYVIIKEHPWRRLKNHGSERVIPLIGASLESARRLLSLTQTGELFPKYCNGIETKSNSASAALNKWMKLRVPNGCVIHSFRHSFRDRLREINCPQELVDELGGWSKLSVGQRYGSGYSIETKSDWLRKIALKEYGG